MMIPSMAEKLGYGLTIGILYGEGRIGIADVMTVFPDLALCVLFAVAFARTSPAAYRTLT
jgi:hypothetical protein